jgi:diguanylate cyclase (GGDEF)-like protein
MSKQHRHCAASSILAHGWRRQATSRRRRAHTALQHALRESRIQNLEARVEAEQRQRQLAETLRSVAAALSASLELSEVLDRLLTSLAQIIPYDSAAVALVEGDQLAYVAARGHVDVETVKRLRIVPKDDTIFQIVAATKRPFALADAHADARFHRYADTDYVRGWLGVPLILRDRVIGILMLDSRRASYYGSHEADIAMAFADQAVIAIENARLFEETRRLAITDGLTGVYNRRHFMTLATREWQRARRYHRPLAVIMLDIDHFKWVNDTYGHAVGDDVLQQVAQRCRAGLREVDILARYGGEEFVILLPDTTGAAAQTTAERLGQLIGHKPYPTAEGKLLITASLGVAHAEADISSVSALLDLADQALYAAKAAGRNRVVAET